MGVIKEFKDFAMKGNVLDLAIGVIIGGAFGKIVGSLIDDVITPLLLKPAMDASNLNNIKDLKLGAVTYGNFLSNLISFAVVAFVLFMVIKAMNTSKRREAEAPLAPPMPSTEQKLLAEIRDLLKK